jgi:hypothetical protein
MLRLAVAAVLLILAPAVHAANPVGICPTAKTGDHAPECSVAVICAVPTQATDMVRTIVAAAQVWEPYATLTAGSAVTPCPNGGWSSLTAQGIPTFANLTPPVVPPVVVPPPAAPPTQAVSVIAVDNPNAAALFPNVPNPECFTLSNGTQSVTACVPPKTP